MNLYIFFEILKVIEKKLKIDIKKVSYKDIYILSLTQKCLKFAIKIKDKEFIEVQLDLKKKEHIDIKKVSDLFQQKQKINVQDLLANM